MRRDDYKIYDTIMLVHVQVYTHDYEVLRWEEQFRVTSKTNDSSALKKEINAQKLPILTGDEKANHISMYFYKHINIYIFFDTNFIRVKCFPSSGRMCYRMHLPFPFDDLLRSHLAATTPSNSRPLHVSMALGSPLATAVSAMSSLASA